MKITLQLTDEQAEKLLAAFHNGELAAYQISNVRDVSDEQEIESGELSERGSAQLESAYRRINEAFDWLGRHIKNHIACQLYREDEENLIEQDKNLLALTRRIQGILESAINQICEEPIPLYYNTLHRISLSVDARLQTFIFLFPHEPPTQVRNLLEEHQYVPSEEGRIWKKIIRSEALKRPKILTMARDYIKEEAQLFHTITGKLRGDSVIKTPPQG